jgi:hypothetical protein
MKSLCLLLVGSAALVASENPREVVSRAIENYQRDAQAALQYTYTEVEKIPNKGVETSRIIPLDGTPYERLIRKNGQPLSAEEEKKEQAKYEKTVYQRTHETAAQRAKRLRKYREDREFLREVPEAFTFQNLPEEAVSGRICYVIQCTPRAEYEPHDIKGRMFSKLMAKMWIDKEDLRIAKADANIIGPLSIGWIMARIAEGGHIEFQQHRVRENFWLPKRIDVSGTARIMLVDTKNIDEEITYSGFEPLHGTPAPAVASTAAVH